MAATAVEFGVTAYVGTKLTGFAEETGEALGGAHGRAVAQRSCSVFINGKPAGRVGDKTSCDGKIVAGSGNVFIGGAPVAVAPIQSEVPEWASPRSRCGSPPTIRHRALAGWWAAISSTRR